MNNNLGIQIFSNEEFSNIRATMIDNEPWFVAKDICDSFCDKNRNRTMAKLDDDEKGYTHMTTPGGRQKIAIVNEFGLYSMLLSMEPSKATARNVSEEYVKDRQEKLKRFKRWITHKVLPELRKNGSYSLTGKQDSYMIDDPVARAERWIEEYKERLMLAEKVQEQEPYVDVAKRMLKSDENIKIGRMAKILCDKDINIGERRLFSYFRNRNILDKENTPYQRYINQGYFFVRESPFTRGKFEGLSKTTLIIPKGQDWIFNNKLDDIKLFLEESKKK